MATLYIREYAGIAMMTNVSSVGPAILAAQAPSEPGIIDQTVPISGSATSSSAFNTNTNMVRIHTDAICSIVFGATPSATTSSARLAANQTEYFRVNAGQKVSVILNV
jgi:hypothetical protein